jgi:predicted O-methyltransferase YrrM
VLHAMSWSAEFSVPAVAPATGEALRLLATTARAAAVVEVGTGLGVSGLWLLSGMDPAGVLTTIDLDPDHQAMARQAFAAAGVAPRQVRMITGNVRTVLPRLADNAYDLVFVDADVPDQPHTMAAAHRLLRADGLLVVHQPDLDAIRDDPQWTPAGWTPAVLPVAGGLFCATKVG